MDPHAFAARGSTGMKITSNKDATRAKFLARKQAAARKKGGGNTVAGGGGDDGQPTFNPLL
jgi:hypothetical protein